MAKGGGHPDHGMSGKAGARGAMGVSKGKGADRGKKGPGFAAGPAKAGGGGASGTTISKARWDKMSDYSKRNEFGTTSYSKYKEGSVGKTGLRKGMRDK